ncbi:Lysm domain receptor-like kinase [Thalictrum thalictroides]|uniref:Lysm domain receptor-like kinase n=1 Tax=Thalictrum thalictroides TaxID=46969 RepID=A0A7J6WAG4_THATH|nr:Lysm domain receptor-like kinase [Thalictrum thalictroides]
MMSPFIIRLKYKVNKGFQHLIQQACKVSKKRQLPLISPPADYQVSLNPSGIIPLTCTEPSTCDSYLYHISEGSTTEQIASYYSVNTSQIKPIYHNTNKDYLVSVPCACKKLNDDTVAYFYDTTYTVQQNDTFKTWLNATTKIYSGQAWNAEDEIFDPGQVLPVHLVCGCVEGGSQVVVTYTVQDHDTLSGISTMLSAKLEGIESLNKKLIQNPAFIDVGWVFLVPMEINGIRASKGKKKMWHIIIAILSSVTLISMGALIAILLRQKRARQLNEEDPKAVSKTISSRRTNSCQSQYCNEDMTAFESERPAIFSLDDIEDATENFDETRKIGEGGYGSVYLGVLGKQEIAVKKMKSNKSKEFFAELKVLCKIHHINVVELLGYASGDDHLYLVYEYVQNGALSEHLHDPLLKGHQPLSWTARTQIALDAARGIEYIHDHTKAHYVHRDIKTSNILLDESLRAKV